MPTEATVRWFHRFWRVIDRQTTPDLQPRISIQSFQISFFLSSYIVPLTLISILYVGMLIRLWHNPVPGSKVSTESRRGKKRVTRMIVFVVLGKHQQTSFVIIKIFILSSFFFYLLNKHKISFRNLLAASSRKMDFLKQLAKYVSACSNGRKKIHYFFPN